MNSLQLTTDDSVSISHDLMSIRSGVSEILEVKIKNILITFTYSFPAVSDSDLDHAIDSDPGPILDSSISPIFTLLYVGVICLAVHADASLTQVGETDVERCQTRRPIVPLCRSIRALACTSSLKWNASERGNAA
ncbi:hypothetical protein EVAR_103349_1 [Eumeta japonica]|uniref:Uncharacterized protein n=1 Tax=Eumeta variegata TaxID=151549 RepID=A0A4C1Y960_EUMVA|nr:hypothetical protein EVAR_103349_1 [Eumeta japonica]